MQSLFLLYDPYGNTRGLKTVHWTVFAGCGPFPGCGTLFLLRGRQPACKKQTAAPALLRLFRPLDAPQLRTLFDSVRLA